jgi:hypothetical protein
VKSTRPVPGGRGSLASNRQVNASQQDRNSVRFDSPDQVVVEVTSDSATAPTSDNSAGRPRRQTDRALSVRLRQGADRLVDLRLSYRPAASRARVRRCMIMH